MEKKVGKQEIKEFYFRTNLGSFVILVYFIDIDKHIKLELDDKKEVTSIAIADGFDQAYCSASMLKEMKLKEASRNLSISDEDWPDFVTNAIVKFISPITDTHCVGSATEIFDQTKQILQRR